MSCAGADKTKYTPSRVVVKKIHAILNVVHEYAPDPRAHA